MRGRNSSIRAVWAPSLARRVFRNRLLRAALVVAIGTACTLSLIGRAAAFEEARGAWGERVQVAIVAQFVAPGDRLDGSIHMREFPVALMPTGAATELPGPTSRAKVGLYPGEVLLADRMTTATNSGLEPGSVAMTLAVVTQVPLMKTGDLVDLWVVDSANLSSQRIASKVVVLAFSDTEVTVAVPADQVARATVASLRPVTVTLVG